MFLYFTIKANLTSKTVGNHIRSHMSLKFHPFSALQPSYQDIGEDPVLVLVLVGQKGSSGKQAEELFLLPDKSKLLSYCVLARLGIMGLLLQLYIT